jgi:hypothetical protein
MCRPHSIHAATNGCSRNVGKVSVFPGSMVPNQAAVAKFNNTQKAGNLLLATGFYEYRCGPHTTQYQSTPGAFLLRNADTSHRTVVVRRSLDDLIYQRSNIADRCQPGDNITRPSSPIAEVSAESPPRIHVQG